MALVKPKILIVDDEKAICDLLSDALHEQGFLCSIALEGSEALAKLASEDFEIVLIDIRLPDVSGIELLAKIRLMYPNVAAVMVTAIDSIDTAVKATKLGASDYIVKPFNLSRLDTSIRTILESKTSSSKKGEKETDRHIGNGEEDKQVAKESYRIMNAIARGVEARLDLSLSYSVIVIEETIGIARQLGIHEEDIKLWAAIRLRHNAKRAVAIQSSLEKFTQNPLAQSMMGMAVPYIYRSKHQMN